MGAFRLMLASVDSFAFFPCAAMCVCLMFAPLYRLHTVNLGKATYSLVHAKIIIQIFDTLNSLLGNGNDNCLRVQNVLVGSISWLSGNLPKCHCLRFFSSLSYTHNFNQSKHLFILTRETGSRMFTEAIRF